MKLVKVLLFLLFIPLLLLIRLLGVLTRRRDLVYLPDDHEDMKKAIEQAKQSLPTFRQMLANPPPNTKDYALKVRFDVEDGTEHCWVGDLKMEGDKFVGTLSNHPQRIAKKLGDTVEVTEAMVSDWLYMQDGVAQGNFTTKALLPHTSETVKAQILEAYGWNKPGFQPAAPG